MSEVVVKRGRPRKFNGTQRRIIAGVVKKHGLSGSLPVLAERGIVCSVQVLRDVAKEKGLVFQRGRPKAKVA